MQKMYFVNITFLCEREELQQLVDHLRQAVIPPLRSGEPAPEALMLMRVSEVLGQPDFADQACSLPLQVSFRSAEARIDWINKVMMPVLGDYSRRFGEKGLVMVSLMEEI